MKILAIDPGWKGGVALLDDQPIKATSFSTLTEKEIILEVLFLAYSADFCYIEKVHSMPAQGVASSFKFGWIYGALRAAIQVAEVSFEEVTPQKWQQALGCLSKGNKNVTKQKAQQLFPGMKVTHGIADALLIAEYGRRLNLNR